MKYTAFVPARSGSKRLPGKNIKMLGEKPLLIWTLEAFVHCDHVDEVILSTDSKEYWEISNSYLGSDKLTLDFRGADEAGDKVKIFDYVKQKQEKIFEERDGAFVMGLPTMPFRNARHVLEAIELFEASEQAVFSAMEYGFPISFAFNKDGEYGWKSVFDDSPMITGNTRSQDQAQSFHPNGALYVRNISDLRNSGLITLYQDAVPYFMERDYCVDIDNEIDFLLAEALVKSGAVDFK